MGQVTFLLRFKVPAGMPTLMRLLPKSRFGQFCSARSICGSLVGMCFALLLGLLMDFLKSDKGLGMGDDAYRIVYVWQTFAYVGLVFCYLQLYKHYCKLGGYGGYKAPAPWSPDGCEKMEISRAGDSSPLWCKLALFGIDFALIGTVLLNLIWSFYAGRINAPAEQKLYLTTALPASLFSLAFYWIVRWRICRSIKRKLNGEDVYVPHHGILFLAMMVRVLLMAALGVQAYVAIKPEGSGIAAMMSAFESGVDVVFVIMIIIFVRLEKLGAATNISEEEYEKMQLAKKEESKA